jgi:3-oxoacyl-(acyl-carrier-protein) synthase
MKDESFMNPLYITGSGSISPQRTWDNKNFLNEVIWVETNYLRCQDPNYKEYITGDMVRRMSRIIKMGVAAGKICMADAACTMPDAIITGTGLGCIEDTEKFLTNMIINNEEFLTPTSFIQSTHNTVSAQIALILKCHNYNFTFVHRGFSFESALLDSFIRINSGESGMVLLGGIDEMTPNTFKILQRLGQYKQNPVNNMNLLKDHSRGTIAGEGAAFFMLSANPGPKNYAKIKALDTFYKPEAEKIPEHINSFLERSGHKIDDLDLVLLGVNGDFSNDQVYNDIRNGLFRNTPQAWFKHLCGEYHTVSSFGLWLAAMMLKNMKVPEIVLLPGEVPEKIQNVLLYNHYRNLDHSLILVSSV